MMGLAILTLMVFHSSIPSFYGLKNLLEFGVDIFLFLSGFTCTLSYCKIKLNNESCSIYYKKRMWRILPPYLILYIFIYGIEYLFKDNWNWTKFFGELLMWDNLIHNSINMWYIPALLLMYSIIPIYVYSYKKWQIVLWLPFIIILFLIGMLFTEQIEILPFRMAWFRLPIFLLGVNTFLLKDKNFHLNSKSVLFYAIIAVILCWILENSHQFELKRLCYIPLVMAIVYFYDRNKLYKKVFKWIGTFSLENYLIHWYVIKLLYDYTAIPVISTVLSLPYFSLFNAHKQGLEALYASIMAIPLALIAAYSYHKILNITIYKQNSK